MEFLAGLRGTLSVTFEEGTWTAWLYDLLKPHVAHLVVCNPRKNALLKYPPHIISIGFPIRAQDRQIQRLWLRHQEPSNGSRWVQRQQPGTYRVPKANRQLYPARPLQKARHVPDQLGGLELTRIERDPKSPPPRQAFEFGFGLFWMVTVSMITLAIPT